MIDRHLRAADHDLGEFLEAEGPARLDGPDRVQAGVVAGDAGIELERDAQGLEALAQAGAELRQIEQIGRARERGAEAAVGRLEHVDDPGEAVAGQQRPVEPALGRAAGMHALDH